MAVFVPNLSEGLYSEILSRVSPLEVNSALDGVCLPNPELETWRDELVEAERHISSGRTERGRLLAPLIGVGFDAGRFALTASGVYIPRVPWIYLGDDRRFPSSLVDRVLEDFYRDVDAKGYIDAFTGWSADNIEEAEGVELVNEGFAEIYIAAERLRRLSSIASN